MITYSLITKTDTHSIDYTEFKDILYSNESLDSEYKLLDNVVYKMNNYISMALTLSEEGFGDSIKIGFRKIIEFLKKIISYCISFIKKMWEAIKKFFLFIKNFLKTSINLKNPSEKSGQEIVTVKLDYDQIKKIISVFPIHSNSLLDDSKIIERYTSISLQYVEEILIKPELLFDKSILNVFASIKSYNNNTINLVDTINKNVSENLRDVVSYNTINIDVIEEYKDEMPDKLVHVKCEYNKSLKDLPISILLNKKENNEYKEITLLKFFNSNNINDSKNKMKDLINSFNNLKITTAPSFDKLMKSTDKILSDASYKMGKLKMLIASLNVSSIEKNTELKKSAINLIIKLYNVAGNNLDSLTRLLQISHRYIIGLYSVLTKIQRDIKTVNKEF